ncbi:MAG TPA: hypothetical protein VE621_00980 [Bryobacteraceae bacterium]|nr:hypothetical protein [Bryobacteraceae bacterium]
MRRLPEAQEHDFNRDGANMYMIGGIALMVLGAGLVLMNPLARRRMGALGVSALGAGALLKTLAPDIQRYMKIRAM